MKKFITSILVVVMIMVMTITASAGSIFGTVGNLFCTLGHTIETGVRAVANTAEYVFTDSSFGEAYSGTKKSASKIADSFIDTVHSTCDIVTDTIDAAVGITKTVGGTIGAAGCGLIEVGERVITGKSDYSLTSSCYELMKDGYKQADNGIVKDIAVIAGVASGIGAPATLGIVAVDMTKSCIQYATGYINDEQMQNKIFENGISLVTAGAGAAAGKIGGQVVKTIATTTISAGSNITRDLLNQKDNRSAFDIVVEDISKSIGTTAFNKTIGAITSDSTETNADTESVYESPVISEIAVVEDIIELTEAM